MREISQCRIKLIEFLSSVLWFVISSLVIVAIMSTALSSGLFWFVFKNRLLENEQFKFQSYFANMPPTKRNILVIGQAAFVNSTVSLFKKQAFTYYTVDAQRFQLVDILLSIDKITIDEFDVIVAQSSPQFWTNLVNNGSQDLRLWNYQREQNNPYFNFKSPPLFWSMIKEWVQGKGNLITKQEPEFLYNASFEFPPLNVKKIWERIENKNLKKFPHVFWVKFNQENLIGGDSKLNTAFNALHKMQGHDSKRMNFVESDTLVVELGKIIVN